MSGVGFDDGDGSSRRQRSSERSAMVFEIDDEEGETHRMRLDPSKDPSDPGWITEIECDAREFNARLPELRLPGTGAELDDCGTDLPVVFCNDCMGSEWAGRTCRRSACPRCNESWAFHGARTDSSKSDALRRKRNVEKNTNKNKQHHVVFSMPNSLRFDSDEPLDRGKELVKALATGIGLSAGNIYYHPWRIKKAYRGDVAGHSSGDGDMTWVDIFRKLASDSWSWDAVEYQFLVFAPHFHVIGTSRFVQGGSVTRDIEEKTGIVSHRITQGGSSVSIYDKEDLCRATAYCRTHTGLSWNDENEEFRAAMWRFGEVANLVPSDKVSAEIDAIMRHVSLDVLGVDFRRSDCAEQVSVDEDSDTGADTSKGGYLPEPKRRIEDRADDRRDLGPSATPSLGSGSSSGERMASDGGWEATTGVSPAFLNDSSESETLSEEVGTERCGGEMIPMFKAPRYFNSDSLREEMPDRAAALEDDYEIWRDAGRPPPD